MLSFDDALARVLAGARPTGPEEVPLSAALGRVLVSPTLVAPGDVPPFANSAMDGFALRSADTPGRLLIGGEVAAGTSPTSTVHPGEAIRIMTGAPLPDGADVVVPLEEVEEADGHVAVPATRPGRHVRAIGSDTAAGDEVCLRGRLGPAAIAVLASLGIADVIVRRRPLVAVLSTGDELVEPGGLLGPGQIHDANGPALEAAIREAGGAPRRLGRVGDSAEATAAALRDAAHDADLIVTSGGVSVGGYDRVREVLERDGRLDFWRIAVQPGKPLAVGAYGGRPLIGLPGNPVSALVTFELFVRPLIRAMLTLSGDGRLRVTARPEAPIPKDPPRRAFLRVVLRQAGQEIIARATGGQGSAQVRALADATALLVVPEGEKAADPAGAYEAIVIGEIG